MAHIVTISGSARPGSYNTALIGVLESMLPSGTTTERLDYSDVPLYRQDLEANFPAAVTAHKDKIKAADGIIISTPEYNRSVPGYLKNFIDWTSRPYGDNAWKGKKVFVVGATGGAIGTALAQYDLKKSLLYLDAVIPGQPEVYIGGANQKFKPNDTNYGTDGELTDESTKEFLAKAVGSFMQFVG